MKKPLRASFRVEAPRSSLFSGKKKKKKGFNSRPRFPSRRKPGSSRPQEQPSPGWERRSVGVRSRPRSGQAARRARGAHWPPALRRGRAGGGGSAREGGRGAGTPGAGGRGAAAAKRTAGERGAAGPARGEAGRKAGGGRGRRRAERRGPGAPRRPPLRGPRDARLVLLVTLPRASASWVCRAGIGIKLADGGN